MIIEDEYKCSGFCAAASYDLMKTYTVLSEKLSIFEPHRYRDVVVFFNKKDDKSVMVFSYGVVLLWGFTKQEENFILESVKISERSVDFVEFEKEHVQFIDDNKMLICGVELARNDFKQKLAFSFASAQSLKLNFFESTIEDSASEVNLLAESLSKNGSVSLSRKQMCKKIGSVFLKKNMINLRPDIIDIPDILWQDDELGKIYDIAAMYFDIGKRMEIINRRLDTMSDLLMLLGEELRFRHSSNVEIIIALLIGFEIIMAVFQVVYIKKY